MTLGIGELSEALHALASKSRLSPDDLEFIAQCLHSKWYGVQVIAAKVLAKFHPPEALPLLKEWMMRHIKSHSLTRIAQQALLSCITADDLYWIFDLYQTNNVKHSTFLMVALLEFPNPTITQQLIQDCQKEKNWNSISILAATLITEREAVFQRLMQNPHVPHKTHLQEAFRQWPLMRDHIVHFKKFNNPV